MSKAFTKETDAETDDDEGSAPESLPAGTKNYMTRDGFAALQEELRRLMRDERPKVVETVAWATSFGTSSQMPRTRTRCFHAASITRRRIARVTQVLSRTSATSTLPLTALRASADEATSSE